MRINALRLCSARQNVLLMTVNLVWAWYTYTVGSTVNITHMRRNFLEKSGNHIMLMLCQQIKQYASTERKLIILENCMLSLSQKVKIYATLHMLCILELTICVYWSCTKNQWPDRLGWCKYSLKSHAWAPLMWWSRSSVWSMMYTLFKRHYFLKSRQIKNLSEQNESRISNVL